MREIEFWVPPSLPSFLNMMWSENSPPSLLRTPLMEFCIWLGQFKTWLIAYYWHCLIPKWGGWVRPWTAPTPKEILSIVIPLWELGYFSWYSNGIWLLVTWIHYRHIATGLSNRNPNSIMMMSNIFSSPIRVKKRWSFRFPNDSLVSGLDQTSLNQSNIFLIKGGGKNREKSCLLIFIKAEMGKVYPPDFDRLQFSSSLMVVRPARSEHCSLVVEDHTLHTSWNLTVVCVTCRS